MNTALQTDIDDLQNKVYSSEELASSLTRLSDSIIANGLPNLLPLLFLLSFQGKPFGLKEHYQLAPLFQLLGRPREFLLKSARQVGKSASLMATSKLQSILIPDFKTLVVTPLFAQSKRLNDDYSSSFVDSSPFKGCFDSSSCRHGALYHKWKNRSEEIFSYAFTSCNRIRGISAVSQVIFDEVQDLTDSFVPVIGETMSASKQYGFYMYSGTPKTLDNFIQLLYERSSQGEWTIPCRSGSCKHENIAALRYDLMRMIGKEGIICAKCGKPIYTEDGYFLHEQPQYINTFKSIHISQVTHPLHLSSPVKWQQLLHKMNTYEKSKFENEILGESSDNSSMPISHSELANACSTSEKDDNTLKRSLEKQKQSGIIITGVDWSGGGNDATSTTTYVCANQIYGSDVIEISYMERMPTSQNANDESRKLSWLNAQLHPDMFAHDYGGAGNIREALMIEQGQNPATVVPFSYDWAPRHKIIRTNRQNDGSRKCYLIDKARSLRVLFAAIKAGKVKFPRQDKCWTLLADFLNIGEERSESPRGSDILLFHRKAGRSDDFVHAVNFACSAIWYLRKSYPQLSGATSHEDDEEVEPKRPDWKPR